MGNSRRKCRHCQAFSDAVTGFIAPLGFFCSIAHAIEFAREKSAKLATRQAAKRSADSAKIERLAKADLRKRKMDVKPIGYWMRRAQVEFNRFIRARDAGLPCISCGHPDDGSRQRHASHYRSVGGNPSERFNELNVWASCSICNSHLSGNLTAFRVALVGRVGIDAVEALEGHHEPKRYRREDYQAIEAEYKAKLKELIGS